MRLLAAFIALSAVSSPLWAQVPEPMPLMLSPPPALLEPLVAPGQPASTAITVQKTATPQAYAVEPGRNENERQALEIVQDQCRRLASAQAPTDAADMRFALGEGQALPTPQDHEQFNLAFSRLLVKKYGFKTPQTRDCRIELLQSSVAQRIQTPRFFTGQRLLDTHTQLHRVMISAQAEAADGSFLPMVYTLEKRSSGYWRILGLSVNGQPLEDLYRAQYLSILHKQGLPALIAHISLQ